MLCRKASHSYAVINDVIIFVLFYSLLKYNLVKLSLPEIKFLIILGDLKNVKRM